MLALEADIILMNLYLCGLQMEVHGKKAKRNLRENSKHILRFTIKEIY